MSIAFARTITLAGFVAASVAVGCKKSDGSAAADSAATESPVTGTSTPVAQPVPSRLVGIVGRWTDSTAASDSALVADGAAWNGVSDTTALTTASARWFGARNATFTTNNAGKGSFPFAIAADIPSFSSGSLRTHFSMRGGASDQNAGILFDLSPTGEYLYARYNTKDGDLALWKFVNGERGLVVHGTGARQLPLNAWHELVVTIRGRELSATIAGDTTLRLTHTLDSAPAGRVGVWVKRDAVTAFRGFVMQP